MTSPHARALLEMETRLAAEHREREIAAGIVLTLDFTLPLDALRPRFGHAARIATMLALPIQTRVRRRECFARGARLGRDPLGAS